jgi:uncharacterized protein (DUF1778 family)
MCGCYRCSCRSHRARLSIDITAAERRRIRMAATRRDESIRDYVMRAIEAQLTADLESENLTALTDTADPVLGDLWKNSKDAAYDDL